MKTSLTFSLGINLTNILKRAQTVLCATPQTSHRDFLPPAQNSFRHGPETLGNPVPWTDVWRSCCSGGNCENTERKVFSLTRLRTEDQTNGTSQRMGRCRPRDGVVHGTSRCEQKCWEEAVVQQYTKSPLLWFFLSFSLFIDGISSPLYNKRTALTETGNPRK